MIFFFFGLILCWYSAESAKRKNSRKGVRDLDASQRRIKELNIKNFLWTSAHQLRPSFFGLLWKKVTTAVYYSCNPLPTLLTNTYYKNYLIYIIIGFQLDLRGNSFRNYEYASRNCSKQKDFDEGYNMNNMMEGLEYSFVFCPALDNRFRSKKKCLKKIDLFYLRTYFRNKIKICQ